MLTDNTHNNIYELRSNDTQEILNKPPNKLINWGNTVIFLTLLIGFWLLTLFQLPVTFEAPVKISMINRFNKIGSLIELTTANNAYVTGQIPIPTTAELFLDDYPSEKYRSLPLTIDSITKQDRGNRLYFTVSSSFQISSNFHSDKSSTKGFPILDRGMYGKIIITAGTESIFKKMLKRLF